MAQSIKKENDMKDMYQTNKRDAKTSCQGKRKHSRQAHANQKNEVKVVYPNQKADAKKAYADKKFAVKAVSPAKKEVSEVSTKKGKNDVNVIYQEWRLWESSEITKEREKLRREKAVLEKERRQFECEKRDLWVQKSSMERLRAQERALFEMKWKILEEELKKISEEKEQLKKQRSFYRYVSSYEKQKRQEETHQAKPKVVSGELFFIGVESHQALKKRYKDLIKIYHPDNLGGDTGTIQEINREYERLKKDLE